jgi:H+/Na+-translocating ferredoxin:NAD+ oxidoreductase subunit G
LRSLIRMIVVLTVICACSALVLAYANKVTKAPREYQLLKYVEAPSIKAVLTTYDNDPIKDRVVLKMGKDKKGRPLTTNIFPAKKGGKLVGLAYEAAGMGHEGLIHVMVGVDTTGKIIGISVTTQSETPGLGSKVVEPSFTKQFKGMTLSDSLNLSAKGGKIDAVSGATVSSKGVVAAVRKALELFPKIKQEIG